MHNSSSNKPTYSAPLMHTPIDTNTTISGIEGNSPREEDDSSSTTKSLRQQLGGEVARVSDFINDNLIVVRYATFSTILLLGVHGIAKTPLFYRYKHVLDIPPRMFQRRKWIHGRIVGVVAENEIMRFIVRNQSSQSFKRSISNSTQRTSGSYGRDDKADSIQHKYRPIVVLFRHSSPMERILTQSSMERFLSTEKSSSPLLYSTIAKNPYHNLLPIELAGISVPPTTINTATTSILSTSLTNQSTSSPFPLLTQLIGKNTNVSIQLLAQRTTPDDNTSASTSRGNLVDDTNKRGSIDAMGDDQYVLKHTAVCHLHYHSPSSWFKSTNASLEMVQSGQAWMNPNGGVVPVPLSNVGKHSSVDKHNIREHTTTTTTLVNFNPTVKQLKDDSQFISKLEVAEYNSWKSKVGIWSIDDMRVLRSEYLAEEESTKMKWKLWSFVKRMWEWMRR
jgi:hypothetical protein